MNKPLFWASLAGGAGVAIGAFGAHMLEGRLPVDQLDAYNVGVLYHMFHALAMLAAGIACTQIRAPWLRRACWGWGAGIVLFSGSLYLLAITGISWLGAITPFGGVAFLAGWAFAAVAGLSSGNMPGE